MKNLYITGGTMGAGTACARRTMKGKGARGVDGDWCWDADPFHVTGETKRMVLDNICHVPNNFIHCLSL